LAAQSEELRIAATLAPRPDWQRLELIGVTHSYRRDDEDGNFTLGPIDLALGRGELIFLIGGNGSGKTTLAKLLTGLYEPEAGEIRFDGQTINSDNRVAYRQYFSAVFSDFYLFESLLGLQPPALDELAREYLKQLQLDTKVQVTGGKFSTTQLSQGQRKRLALLIACLEDRPIYLFDEWAADQDPYFKDVFYLRILPELKARGKTIIVISHDERYYRIADRIIKLDYGQLVLGQFRIEESELMTQASQAAQRRSDIR
jgi:putative ATP-binding cassette transporter